MNHHSSTTAIWHGCMVAFLHLIIMISEKESPQEVTLHSDPLTQDVSMSFAYLHLFTKLA